jgi:hypothetical protein
MSSSAEVPVEHVEYYPDCSHQQLEAVLDTLAKWSVRNSANVAHLRAFPRRELRGVVTVRLTHRDPKVTDKEAPLMRLALRVPARNISQGGLGLVAPTHFMPPLLTDATPLLKTDDLLREGVLVTVQLARDGAPPLVIDGMIARLRPTHQGFFDVGVKFLERKAGDLGGARGAAIAGAMAEADSSP